ncbi:MAG: hypothetical protein OXI59_21650, partial [Gemmatimonadota bacterium]|nr:hypothetical protein [Gemmatimonadota bacterium]
TLSISQFLVSKRARHASPYRHAPATSEIGVEYAGVVALKFGDVVVGVPLIKDTGKKGVE